MNRRNFILSSAAVALMERDPHLPLARLRKVSLQLPIKRFATG